MVCIFGGVDESLGLLILLFGVPDVSPFEFDKFAYDDLLSPNFRWVVLLKVKLLTSYF